MRSKYGAVRTDVDGVTFASKKEANRYGELKLLEKAGFIHALALQPVFPLHVRGRKIAEYRADFQYFDKEKNALVVEDVKGIKTPVYKLKKKLTEALYDIQITEV